MHDTTVQPQIEPLRGHTSKETACLVEDYPYGFRLRCQIRYWIETKPGHGQRTVSQTTNPKRPGIVWNQPKPSTYSAVRVLYRDLATGHIESDGLSGYADESQIAAFAARYGSVLTERDRHTIEVLTARQRAAARVTWTVTSGNESQQTPAEQASIMHKLTALELQKMRTDGDK